MSQEVKVPKHTLSRLMNEAAAQVLRGDTKIVELRKKAQLLSGEKK